MQRVITHAMVPDYLLDMVKVVHDDSGYWPVLVEDDELPWDSEVSPASRGRPDHAISFSPAYVGHRHHLLFRGCAEVMREWIAREHGESAETEVDASGP